VSLANEMLFFSVHVADANVDVAAGRLHRPGGGVDRRRGRLGAVPVGAQCAGAERRLRLLLQSGPGAHPTGNT